MLSSFPSGPRKNRKLNDEQVKEIFLSAKNPKNLAKLYKVSESTIRQILKRETYRDVTGKLRRETSTTLGNTSTTLGNPYQDVTGGLKRNA